MTGDWLEDLDSDERAQWDDFVDRFRRTTLKGIVGSGMFVALEPADDFNVRFATELGTAIMLDKPILAVVHPGASVPGKLRGVIDELVEADVDTEEGQQIVAEAIERFKDTHG